MLELGTRAAPMHLLRPFAAELLQNSFKGRQASCFITCSALAAPRLQPLLAALQPCEHIGFSGLAAIDDDGGANQQSESLVMRFDVDPALGLELDREGSSDQLPHEQDCFVWDQLDPRADEYDVACALRVVHARPSNQKRPAYGESSIPGLSRDQSAVTAHRMLSPFSHMTDSHEIHVDARAVMAGTDSTISLFALPKGEDIPFEALRGSIRVWDEQPEGTSCCFRSLPPGITDHHACQRVVQLLLGAGAFPDGSPLVLSTARGEEGHADEPTLILERLAAARMVKCTGKLDLGQTASSSWLLTEKGAQMLIPSIRLRSPVAILQWSPDDPTPIESLHPILLHDMLWQRGWKCEIVSDSIRRPGYRAGMPLVWYLRQTARQLPVTYLQCLASSSAILASGKVDCIKHLRARNYYAALLRTHEEPPRRGAKRPPIMNFIVDPELFGLLDQPSAKRRRGRAPAGPDYEEQPAIDAEEEQRAIEDNEDWHAPDSCVETGESGTDDDAFSEVEAGKEDANDHFAERHSRAGTSSNSPLLDSGLAADVPDAADSPPAAASDTDAGNHQQSSRSDDAAAGEQAEHQIARFAPAGISRSVSEQTYEWLVEPDHFFRFTHVHVRGARKARWQVLCRAHADRCRITRQITPGSEEILEARLRQWALDGLTCGSKAMHKTMWVKHPKAADLPNPAVVAEMGLCYTPQEYAILRRAEPQPQPHVASGTSSSSGSSSSWH